MLSVKVTGNKHPHDDVSTSDLADSNVDTGLCRLIAWLSVCVLAAAWGSSLDEAWRPIWRLIGVFGLVSAFGLSTAQRLHLAYRRRVARRAAEGLLSNRLATELFQRNAPERLRPIIERFIADFQDTSSTHSDRRLGTDLHPPVHLYPLDHDVPDSARIDLPGVIARVRNISLNGIGMAHEERLPTGPLVLVYVTRAGERLVVGVHLSWCRPTGDGEYASGGYFVEFNQTDGSTDNSVRELQTA